MRRWMAALGIVIPGFAPQIRASQPVDGRDFTVVEPPTAMWHLANLDAPIARARIAKMLVTPAQ